MPSSTSRPAMSSHRTAHLAGYVLSALTALIFLASAFAKLGPRSPDVVEQIARFGYPDGALGAIAAVELACLLLYLVPRTSLLGAVLLTGYLGGAVATHVRNADNFVMPIVVGVLAWGGLYLRDDRVHDILLPFAPRH